MPFFKTQESKNEPNKLLEILEQRLNNGNLDLDGFINVEGILDELGDYGFKQKEMYMYDRELHPTDFSTHF